MTDETVTLHPCGRLFRVQASLYLLAADVRTLCHAIEPLCDLPELSQAVGQLRFMSTVLEDKVAELKRIRAQVSSSLP